MCVGIKEEYIGIGDVRCEKGGSFNLPKITSVYPSIAEELEEAGWDTFQPGGHKMGGYAYFTQSDPRIDSDAFKEYVLLLPIDSIGDIMWGDCGVANFFIHPDDLEKKIFRR